VSLFFRDWEPQSQEQRARETIMADLNRYIRRFWATAELTVFGSSGNGFAFRHSDLDISLTFKDQPTAENLNCIEVSLIGSVLVDPKRFFSDPDLNFQEILNPALDQ